MSQLPVTAASLGKLDSGMAGLIIDAAIREAISDLEDRGFQDEKPRKVNIVLTFKLLDNGQVHANVEATPKVPMRKTASTVGEFKQGERGAQLMFREASPDDPRQTTIQEILDDVAQS